MTTGGLHMQDRHALRTVLTLTLPLVLGLAAGCLLGGELLKDALYAALKLVVIR